uniref:Uncharacterized protein n=1 Tax=Picea glauca TaxID=3330 RepID=A0A101M346_PICGL|nr:hypothetical protein ABT39_MTgene37 [Picea glauca]
MWQKTGMNPWLLGVKGQSRSDMVHLSDGS